MMDFVEKTIRHILSNRKLLWVGGGHYLTKPSLKNFLAGGIVFSLEDHDENSIGNHWINLENNFFARPDWNRMSDEQTYENLPRVLEDNLFKNWKNSFIFPYYVSTYSEWLSQYLSAPIIGNPSWIGEKLYLRTISRKVVADSGIALPSSLEINIQNIPLYYKLKEIYGTDHFILNPPYSDGGAWIYSIHNQDELSISVSDILNNFLCDYIEITPYYEGIPMNITICNVPSKVSDDCGVVVYPPSVQIIGESSLSDNKLRYCGCDFFSAFDLLNLIDKKILYNISLNIGKALFHQFSWKGIFGFDFILKPDGSFVFLEINPRLQSSTHILDMEFRDEFNPILQHISSFLLTHSKPSDINLMNIPIKKSMLIAYNAKNCNAITIDNIPTAKGVFGLPKLGEKIFQGGILFRRIISNRVLSNNYKNIIPDIKQEVIYQIENSFCGENNYTKSINQ